MSHAFPQVFRRFQPKNTFLQPPQPGWWRVVLSGASFSCWGALSDFGRAPIFRGVATGDGFQTEAETSGDFFFTQGCLTGENAGENFLPAC